jgi:AhpC/TSA family
VWQSLHASLREHNFTVLTVAMDEAEAARPWIEQANPTYPCLIDRNHHVAELYNMVNVPQATWIDEAGRFVRPPENAGSSDAFRQMDRRQMQMSPEQIAERQRTKQTYIAAVRDWVAKGSASKFAYDAAAIQRRLELPNDGVARAHAHFRLAQALLRRGKEDEAALNFAAASQLHPQSWTIWRQGAKKDASGLAVGPEFWARVDALGDRPYHRPIDMQGIGKGEA